MALAGKKYFITNMALYTKLFISRMPEKLGSLCAWEHKKSVGI
jgi:hypothetical protein